LEPNAGDLQRHYASLSDEALLAVERSDLTPVAQTCYDEEVANREIVPGQENGTTADAEDEPDWIEESVCACSFEASPGNNSAPDLEEARNILESAEIPCYVKVGPALWELLVPGGFSLSATSVLDKEFFNPRLEAEWRTHLRELSDEDFDALNLDDLTAGLMDRVDRLARAYTEEQERRNG
jgi:hypothetical protein